MNEKRIIDNSQCRDWNGDVRWIYASYHNYDQKNEKTSKA